MNTTCEQLGILWKFCNFFPTLKDEHVLFGNPPLFIRVWARRKHVGVDFDRAGAQVGVPVGEQGGVKLGQRKRRLVTLTFGTLDQ